MQRVLNERQKKREEPSQVQFPYSLFSKFEGGKADNYCESGLERTIFPPSAEC